MPDSQPYLLEIVIIPNYVDSFASRAKNTMSPVTIETDRSQQVQNRLRTDSEQTQNRLRDF